MSILPHTVTAAGGGEIVLWFKTGALTPYLKTEPTADTAASVARTEEQVKGHSRRQYPGDPSPISVAAHDRMQMRGRPSKSAVLPGSNAYIEEEVPDGNKTKTKVVTFTFQGDFADLLKYFQSNSSKAFGLRSPGGRYYANGFTATA